MSRKTPKTDLVQGNQDTELMPIASSAEPSAPAPAEDYKEEKRSAARSRMAAVPAAVLNHHLAPFFKNSELAVLTCVDKYTRGVFSTGALKARKQVVVNQLLRHVVTGDQAAAEGMIKKDPALLLEIGQATDLSWRPFTDVTALMLAAGAGDADMTAVIAAGLDELSALGKCDVNEKLKQYQAQFPLGENKEEQKRETDDTKAIERIYAKISGASEETCELLLNRENEIPADNKEAHQLLIAMHAYRHHWEPYGYYVLTLDGDEKEPQPHRLYVKLKAGGFTYTVLDPNNERVSGEIAAEDFGTLSAEERAHLKDLTPASNLSVLQPYLSHILKITSEKGHTKPCQVIKTGKHFSLAIVIKTFELYDTNYDAFGQVGDPNKWDSPKNKLCWRKVVGYAQRHLTACDKQAFAQGIYPLVYEGKKLSRSFEFRFGGGAIFPPAADSNSGLGYGSVPPRACGPGAGGGGVGGVGILCQTKTAAMQRLIQRPCNQSKSRCLVM
jgi:hypothetical protein